MRIWNSITIFFNESKPSLNGIVDEQKDETRAKTTDVPIWWAIRYLVCPEAFRWFRPRPSVRER
jgi:hypothetical protein